MKRYSLAFVSLLLLLSAGVPAFAESANSTTLSVTYSPPAPIGEVDVPVTPQIRDWFTKHGVDGTLIDAHKVSDKVDQAIHWALVSADRVYEHSADNPNPDLHVNQQKLEDELIKPALAAALQPGKVELARMRIGNLVWELRS
jgi:hypothetical protein